MQDLGRNRFSIAVPVSKRQSIICKLREKWHLFHRRCTLRKNLMREIFRSENTSLESAM